MNHAAIGLAIAATLAFPVRSAAKDVISERVVPETFAQCVVAKMPDLVRKGITANWAAEYYVLQISRNMRNDCAKLLPLPPGPDLRYQLAQEMLEKSDVLNQQFDFHPVPPLDGRLVGGELMFLNALGPKDQDVNAVQKQQVDRDRTLSQVGECTVRTDADQARKYLASPGDGELLNAIVGVVMTCTPPNTRIEFKKDTMTGLVALSYLRLAYAAGYRDRKVHS